MDRQQRISISNVNQQNVPVKQAQSIDVTIGGGVTTPATSDKLGLVKVGSGLSIAEDGTLSVDTADKAEKDNTKPITSAGVYTEIGNINALLATI